MRTISSAQQEERQIDDSDESIRPISIGPIWNHPDRAGFVLE
jgi:hypothetical protein